ncbi:hypothetical protein ACFSOZ_07195 [Mesorhizobium newzealandense]|uniref:Uncharacterized protein n=1 Tax=Mesorhizobium newzealandense TaxID=1300302 RepID=A0ABW4U6G2_9HYPH
MTAAPATANRSAVSMKQPPSKPLPMVQGKILVQLFDLRQRCVGMGFSDEDIAASMRQAPEWFSQLPKKEPAE